MNKLYAFIILILLAVLWYRFEVKSAKATTGSEISSDMPATNFTGADFTGANLAGVSLDGVILCNTTMPDGAKNNRDCQN